MRVAFARGAGLAVLVLLVQGPAWGAPPAPEEIARRGKAALVLVKGGKQAPAPAFRIHPAGWYVAADPAARLVAGTAGTVSLVLDPGLKTEKLLEARLVRSDPDLNLALLRVEGDKDRPVLPLAPADNLVELKELVAFGFPAGKKAAGPDEVPALAVQAVRVTSLRRQEGAVVRVQMSLEYAPGNLGGPLLDEEGRVAAVISGPGPDGKGSLAVPASLLARFLARPEIHFTPPAITRQNMHQPLTFEARAIAVLPTAQPPTLQLILRSGDGTENRATLKPEDGVYRVTTVPVPVVEGPRPLRFTALYAGGSVQGRVKDQPVQVGGEELRLSDVRRLQLQPRGRAFLHDGRVVDGEVSGLAEATVRVGPADHRLNLARAQEVTVEPPARVDAVSWTLVALQDGKEVLRQSGTIAIDGAGARSGARWEIHPPPLDADRVVRELGAAVRDVAVGGGGRFLILHLPGENRLDVFDVSQGRVVGKVPAAEPNVLFAAGMEKLYVLLPGKKVLERWSLRTLERESASPLPVPGAIRFLAMGAASDGPLFVGGGPDTRSPARTLFTFLDPATMKTEEVEINKVIFFGLHPTFRMHCRASADGRVFGLWSSNGYSPRDMFTVVRQPKKNEVYFEQGLASGHVVPSPDGQMIHTNWGLFTSQLKPLDKGPRELRFTLPANHGSYYLEVPAGEWRRTGEPSRGVVIFATGNSRPLLSLPHVDVAVFPDVLAAQRANKPITIPADKRVHFIPEANLIITVPLSDDRLLLQRVDIDALLEASGLDYLAVTSLPPGPARRGEPFTYPLGVKSRKGGVRYRLESGPPGMAVSPGGVIAWQVPADLDKREASAVVVVSDVTGQECRYTFQLDLVP